MSKAHFELFFTLFILLASALVVQIEGWGCDESDHLDCWEACRLYGYFYGGFCQGLIYKTCACIGLVE
ncbi:hypothetical protein QL285_016114 [Trifolium repens]|nr:hypothetical protein QL285_016114 [Trifolium repens]